MRKPNALCCFIDSPEGDNLEWRRRRGNTYEAASLQGGSPLARAHPTKHLPGMLIGIFLILFGALLLLDRMHLIELRLGDYLLPIILVALGASMVFKRRKPLPRPKQK